MAKKTIQTSIQIQASPARVWSILTDFAAYPNWNPFLKFVEGDLEVGKKLKINAAGTSFKPTILVCEPNRELRWLGHLMVKGLFDGEHIFQILDHENGTLTFKHEEYFSGLLVGALAKKIDTEFRQHFEQMNEKLKERSEKKMA